jgi:hypothetical protein
MAVLVGLAVGGGLVAVAVGSGVSVGNGAAVGGTEVSVGITASVGAKSAVMVISGVGKTKGVGAAKAGRLHATAIPRISRTDTSINLRCDFIHTSFIHMGMTV